MKFFLGLVMGIALTFAGLYIYNHVDQQEKKGNDNIHYLEKPVSYENKEITSLQIFQVFDGAALATEARYIGDIAFYTGNTVFIFGKNFYTDQIITIKNPQRIGTYSYTTRENMPMTVPILDGQISE